MTEQRLCTIRNPGCSITGFKEEDSKCIDLHKFMREKNITPDFGFDPDEPVIETEKRDPFKIYNLYTFDKLKEQFKNIDWDYLFNSFNFPKNDKIIITEPKYFEFLNNYLENTDNHRIIKNYFKYRLAKYSSK